MSDTQRNNVGPEEEAPMIGWGELEQYESAERDPATGELVPVPGARAAKKVNDLSSDVRKQLEKTPMGPEPREEEDDRSPEAEGIRVEDGVIQRDPRDDRTI